MASAEQTSSDGRRSRPPDRRSAYVGDPRTDRHRILHGRSRAGEVGSRRSLGEGAADGRSHDSDYHMDAGHMDDQSPLCDEEKV